MAGGLLGAESAGERTFAGLTLRSAWLEVTGIRRSDRSSSTSCLRWRMHSSSSYARECLVFAPRTWQMLARSASGELMRQAGVLS